MGTWSDLTGKRFSRLVVIKPDGYDKLKRFVWLCVCDCGNLTRVNSNNLNSGNNKSCGCLKAEQNRKHGHTKRGWSSRTYKSWESMKRRCYNDNDREHIDYRTRGIKVCDRWLGPNGFINFLEDMGERPPGTSLDRIDNNGDYCKENCRWATPEQQQQNTRLNRLITFDGRTQNLMRWIRELGFKKSTITHRLDDLGWSIEKAFTTPVDTSRWTRKYRESRNLGGINPTYLAGVSKECRRIDELRNKTIRSGYEGRLESSTKE